MSDEIRLTANEWDIMKVLWAKQPCTLRTIINETYKTHMWTRHAVISFLKKMEAKGTINVDETGPVKVYTAAVEQDDAIRQELGSTLSRIFDDSRVMMVSYLAKSGDVTDEELEQMIAVLKGEEKNGNGDE